jgi:hypothetical protein
MTVLPHAPSARARPSADPVRTHSEALAYRLSTALAVVAALAAAVGVLAPGVFRDPAASAGSARGTALVILLIAVPLLVAAMRLATRGVAWASVAWLGALAYILYNSVVFAFDVAFNELFLLYVAALSLAIWSTVTLLLTVDAGGIHARLAGLPARGIAIYLWVTAALTLLAWLAQIIPALLTGSVPAGIEDTIMPTNPFHVMDLAVMLPITALAALWLWQGRSWGYLLEGVLLVFFVLEALSVAVDQVFAHLHDPAYPLAMAPVFAVLALIGLAPLSVFLRAFREQPLVPEGERAP